MAHHYQMHRPVCNLRAAGTNFFVVPFHETVTLNSYNCAFEFQPLTQTAILLCQSLILLLQLGDFVYPLAKLSI